MRAIADKSFNDNKQENTHHGDLLLVRLKRTSGSILKDRFSHYANELRYSRPRLRLPQRKKNRSPSPLQQKCEKGGRLSINWNSTEEWKPILLS